MAVAVGQITQRFHRVRQRDDAVHIVRSLFDSEVRLQKAIDQQFNPPNESVHLCILLK